MRKLVIGAALAAIAVSPVHAASRVSPAVLVRRLYAHVAPPSRVERIFAADLAEAYGRDTGRPGEVGAIDFDWRYGAQDFKISSLKVLELPEPPVIVGAPHVYWVAARFKNFGKPIEVDYRVCRNAAGAWRIADVKSDEADRWDLRDILKLPVQPVHC
jgi:hypothetical protein